jgi:hypothetical protein
MRTVSTLISFAIIGLMIHLAVINEPKPDPRVERMAKEMFIHELKKGYLAYKDSSELRAKSIRIYLPIAIKCNTKHK